MKKALALDIGGTNLRCALINENYEIEKVIIKDTLNTTIEDFLNQTDKIIEEFGDLSDVVAISAGVPGPVRWDGHIIELPNIGIKNIPLAKHLSEKFNKLAYVNNDAVMAAFAEGCVGVGKDYACTCFITISTGVGVSLIRNSKSDPVANELGHVLIKLDNKEGLYEFEKVCSGRYLVNLCKDNGLIVENAKEFFELKSKGDELALKVFDIWIHGITTLIQFIKKTFGADIIVLSGGVLKSKDHFLDELKALNSNIKIEVAAFGQNAGLIGAAYYAFNPEKN